MFLTFVFGYILAYNVDAQCVQRNCEAPIAILAHFILSGNVWSPTGCVMCLCLWLRSLFLFVWECFNSLGRCDVSVVAVALIVAETSGEKSIKLAPKTFTFIPQRSCIAFVIWIWNSTKISRERFIKLPPKSLAHLCFHHRRAINQNWSDSWLGIYLLVRWHLFSWRYFDIFLWVD